MSGRLGWREVGRSTAQGVANGFMIGAAAALAAGFATGIYNTQTQTDLERDIEVLVENNPAVEQLASDFERVRVSLATEEGREKLNAYIDSPETVRYAEMQRQQNAADLSRRQRAGGWTLVAGTLAGTLYGIVTPFMDAYARRRRRLAQSL